MPKDEILVSVNDKKREACFTLSGEYRYRIEVSGFKTEINECLKKESSSFHLMEINEAIIIPQGEVRVGFLTFKHNNVWDEKDIDSAKKLIDETIKKNSSPVSIIKGTLGDDNISHRF